MELADKVVVITGAGSGIGRELALELVRRDARVAAVDVKPAGLAKLAGDAGAGDRLTTHVADVSDRVSIEALPRAVTDAHGAVDVVINNAGVIQPFVKVADLDYDDIERMMNINFYGTLYAVKAFLPLLLERPSAHICNVSSMGGFLPVPGQAIYGASKAAVKLMTEALYAELLDTNVGVSCVMPGAVATNIAENSGVHVEGADASEYKSTPADEAARTILDAIEDDEFHVLVGSDARLMSLAHRIAPEGSVRLIRRQMKDLLGD